MKIDRLIGIISILLQNEKVTAPYLAGRFEVSRRTINRDVEDLCMAGIPVITMQGSNGGISIADGYKVDKTLFTSKEMQAIFAGLKSLDSISGNSKYRQLMDKLSGKTHIPSREMVYDSSGQILIDLSSHYKETLAPKIEFIRHAMEQKELITFEYYNNKGQEKRKIEPYLVVFKWANWYVWGYCRGREDFRLFKLNRLLNLEIFQESFELRKLPSFRNQMDQYFTNQIHLVARFNSSVKWKLVEEYGLDSFTEIEKDILLFEFDFTNKEYLLSWILSFGNQVEILEPLDIRTEYIKLINEIQKKYKVT